MKTLYNIVLYFHNFLKTRVYALWFLCRVFPLHAVSCNKELYYNDFSLIGCVYVCVCTIFNFEFNFFKTNFCAMNDLKFDSKILRSDVKPFRLCFQLIFLCGACMWSHFLNCVCWHFIFGLD